MLLYFFIFALIFINIILYSILINRGVDADTEPKSIYFCISPFSLLTKDLL